MALNTIASTTLDDNAQFVRYWPFTSNANDTEGSLNLTNNNSVTFGADGAVFSATNQSLTTTTTLGAGGNSVTHAFIVEITTHPTGTQVQRFFIDDVATSNNQIEVIFFYENNSGTPRLRLYRYEYGIGDDFNVTYTTTLSSDTPYRFVYTHNGSFADLWIGSDSSAMTRIIHQSSTGLGTTGSDNDFRIGPASSGNQAGFKVFDYGVWNTALSDADIAFFTNNAYTLTAEVGSFTLTGNNASFNRTIGMTAGTGAFTLTGIDTGLSYGRTLTAETGSFLLTGNDAAFTKGTHLAAGTGVFTLTGNDASFISGKNLTAETGSFVITWPDVGVTTTAFSYETKPTTSWTDDSKPSSVWVNDSL